MLTIKFPSPGRTRQDLPRWIRELLPCLEQWEQPKNLLGTEDEDTRESGWFNHPFLRAGILIPERMQEAGSAWELPSPSVR